MNHRDERLGSAPLGKLMFSLALPSVAAQLINVLYNIVDRMYIGHIPGYGNVALTGVGVTFPILTMISAFSAFAGMGGAPLASIQLGKQNRQRAEQILGNSAGLLVLFSVILTAFFSIFKTPVLYAFGASDATIVYARDYISIYLIGTIFVQLALGLNTYISGQGEAKIAMLSVLIGAVLNICLDPLFIFVLHMGVRGAAVATVLSQAVSAIWVVHFLVSEKSVMRLTLKNMHLKKDVIKMIAGLGVSPFIMQSTESLVTITLNTGLQRYGGDLYVGSMSILMSIMQMITIPVQGITQGIQPIISYNFGAGASGRVIQARRIALATAVVCGMTAMGLFVCCPRILVGFFLDTDTPAALIAIEGFPLFASGFVFFIVNLTVIGYYQSLERVRAATTFALLRGFVLLVPAFLLLPRVAGISGIWLAMPLSELLTCAVIAVFYNLRRGFGLRFS